MSGGAIAGLIAAGAFSVLVLFGCYVLFKLGKIFDEAAARVRQTGLVIDEGTARVRQAGSTVDEVNLALSHVNKELDRVDAITANVQSISTNISSLTALFSATLGGPVVRVAAFTYGVRRAAAKRARADIESRVAAEIKAERTAHRGTRRGGAIAERAEAGARLGGAQGVILPGAGVPGAGVPGAGVPGAGAQDAGAQDATMRIFRSRIAGAGRRSA